jgi:hypothetical protein
MNAVRRATLLFLFSSCLWAQSPVYVVLWFDTEDYIEPAADDAALRIADDLAGMGVRATFKVVGEKARILESRSRGDVIRALAAHNIGYHSDFHSIQPVPAVYLRRLGFVEGADEFERRESAGAADIRRIFGVAPICYGQPGSSWGPQTNLALRRMGIPVYLDEGDQVGLDQQPFWYGGLLYIYNMGRYQIRPNLDHEERNADILRQFDAAAQRLASAGGGVISTYFHPTEFVTTEFWDAVNFARGATRERKDWARPRLRTPADRERCFKVLRGYVEHAKKMPGVRFVTAQDVLRLYRPQAPPRVDRAKLAAHLSRQITFLRTESGDLSAAEILLQLLGLDWRMVDGPSNRGITTYDAETIPRALFDRAKQDAIAFVTAHHRLPSEVFIDTRSLSLADFAATVAGDSLSPAPVRVLRGQLEMERYFATDAQQSFRWAIHPDGFAAPELLELARLQGWTLKPARLR